MSLFKYLQLTSSALPKPDGPLSIVVPCSSIASANGVGAHIAVRSLDSYILPVDYCGCGDMLHGTERAR